MKLNRVKWTTQHDIETFKNGWGLFKRDDGRLEIQALDDPEGIGRDFHIVITRIFNGLNRDKKAIDYVRQRAKQGCDISKLALSIVADQPKLKRHLNGC